jgi:Domain of unknown function (DUF1707)
MPEPHLRAADTDREAVTHRLGEHMAAGRLSLAEYEERSARAWAAKTYGELADLTADLPPEPAARPAVDLSKPSPAATRSGSSACGPWARHGRGGAVRAAWAGWLTTALIVLTIWLATSLSSGALLPFWPIWVIGPWGAALLARTVLGTPARHDRRSRRR